MYINFEYLLGYSISLLLALSSAISVFVSLSLLAPIGISIVCAFACFFLNLVLYWRDFGDILKSFQGKQSLSAVILTFCGSILMYAFTLLSITELRQSVMLIKTLIPDTLMHIVALANAMGTFGLYINDCNAIIDHGFDQKLLYALVYCISFALPHATQLLWVCIVSMAIYLDAEHDELDGAEHLISNLASFASITLCVVGFSPSITLLYTSIQSIILQRFVQLVGYVGLIALGLCDIQFSVNEAKHFYQHAKRPESWGLTALLMLAVLNAVANSAISAGSYGLLSLNALLGASMSYMVMHNSMNTLYEDTAKQKPPFNQNYGSITHLLYLNIAIIFSYASWLKHYHYKTYQKINQSFSKPVFMGMSYKPLSAIMIYAAHLGLSKANTSKEKQKDLPASHQLYNPLAL